MPRLIVLACAHTSAVQAFTLRPSKSRAIWSSKFVRHAERHAPRERCLRENRGPSQCRSRGPPICGRNDLLAA